MEIKGEPSILIIIDTFPDRFPNP